MNTKRKWFAITHVCKYLIEKKKNFPFPRVSFFLSLFCGLLLSMSYFSSSHSSSQSLILKLPNNLIVYQTIFASIFSNKTKRIFRPLNKTKFARSSIEQQTSRTFPQHGLLIDKYLMKKTLDDDNETNDSLTWKSFLPFVVFFLVLFLCYYFRENLLKTFRERRKRSVLKYSV